jgi:hypothetical protein
MSDLTIVYENDTNARFERDGCIIELRIEDNINTVHVKYFKCDGFRGGGKGKRLMLDSILYFRSKHSNLENVSIWPVVSLDIKKIVPLSKEPGFNFERYRDEQQTKLERYYNSLGFTGDGPILYGNISNIIESISASRGGTRKSKTKKGNRNKTRKSKKNK